MTVNIRFSCPACEVPNSAQPGASAWHCASCDHELSLTAPSAEPALTHCAVCGNRELYRKKDFPHVLGMTILVIACLATVVTQWLYHHWWTWAILLGSAGFDTLLYLFVGDVVVCYRCDAQYRGYPPNVEHKPHEISVAERYRQERLRREQLR